MENKAIGTGSSGYDYRYNGIERNEELGLDLAPFRSYDPAIGRWLQVDPLAEAVPGVPPYRFGFNNPLRYTDALGLLENNSNDDPDSRKVQYDEDGNPTGVRLGYSRQSNEPPSNGIPYFYDASWHYYWNDDKNSYDHHDRQTNDYIGQFRLDIDEFGKVDGDYFMDFSSDMSGSFSLFDNNKTPVAALSLKIALFAQGPLFDVTDQNRYPGVMLLVSDAMSGAVTLGNVIFMNKSYYNRSFEIDGGNSLARHEYGHYLHFKHHFNFNFAAYGTHVGIPSIGSAAGMGTYGGNHSNNPVEKTANILSAGFFKK
jgi:RHS repeat-associated protein